MKPTVTQYAQAFLALASGENISQQRSLAKNFLGFLMRRKESKKISRIVRSLGHLAQVQAGEFRVRVVTAAPLSSEELETVAKQAAKIFEAENMIVEAQVDPSMRGGILLQTDNEVFDATVATRLRQLSKHLNQ